MDMKYKEIAKVLLLKRGADDTVTESDAALVDKELNEGREAFTPKQAQKVQDALTDLASKLRKKWKL
jgi:hypothetical protein